MGFHLGHIPGHSGTDQKNRKYFSYRGHFLKVKLNLSHKDPIRPEYNFPKPVVRLIMLIFIAGALGLIFYTFKISNKFLKAYAIDQIELEAALEAKRSLLTRRKVRHNLFTGFQRLQQGEIDRAYKNFERVLKRDPFNNQAHIGLKYIIYQNLSYNPIAAMLFKKDFIANKKEFIYIDIVKEIDFLETHYKSLSRLDLIELFSAKELFQEAMNYGNHSYKNNNLESAFRYYGRALLWNSGSKDALMKTYNTAEKLCKQTKEEYHCKNFKKYHDYIVNNKPHYLDDVYTYNYSFPTHFLSIE
ncbi:MAG: hypothetical protein AAGK97_14680 [Bacteroidota bacterium]